MRSLLPLSCVVALATLVAAQDGNDRPAGPQYRFELDDGLVRILSPEGAQDPIEPQPVWSLADEGPFRGQVLGPVLFPFMLFPGATDLVSLSDADRFFERLGTTDAELLQWVRRPAEPDDPAWVGLRRILAVRAAGERGMKPMLGIFDAVLEQDGLDPELRRAIVEVRAQLRGEEVPAAPAPDLLPLADLLAHGPADAGLVAVGDQWRLPPGTSHARFARLTHPMWDLSSLFLMFSSEEVDHDLLAARNREAAGLIGWELARMFGNVRVHRIALMIEPMEEEFAFLYEGRFDWTGLEERLSSAGYNASTDDEGRVILTDEDLHATFGPRVVALRNELPEQFLAAEAAKAWAEKIGTGGAPIVVVRDDDFAFPDMEELPFVPTRVEVTMGARDIAPLELVVEFDSTAAAEGAESLLTGAPRMLEGAVEDYAAMDPVVEWVRGLKVASNARLLARMQLSQ